MKRFFVRGKKRASRILAGCMAALMVVTTMPDAALEVRAEGEPVITSAEKILGNAVNFGIVAKGLTQVQHMQTNYAVNLFENPDFVNNDPDLITAGDDGNVIIPFYAANIKDGHQARLDNFETNVSNRKQVIFYTPDTSEVSIKSPSNITYYLISKTQSEIEGIVNGMITQVVDESKELAQYDTFDINTCEKQDQNQYVIDVTGQGQTVYIKVPADAYGFKNAMNSQGIDIVKKSDQVIVFNLMGTSIDLKQFEVRVTDMPAYGDLAPNTLINSTGDMHLGNRNNFLCEEVMKKIIWNMPEANEISIENSCGTYLVPQENATVTLRNTSTGWLVSNGNFVQSTGEWHFPYAATDKLPGGQGDVTLIAYKEYYQKDGVTPAAEPDPQAEFGLYKDAACTIPALDPEKAQPFNGRNVVFFAVELPESGTATYYIKEKTPPGASGEYAAVDGVIQCVVDTKGQVYYSHVGGSGVSLENAYPVYKNVRNANATTGTIVLGKSIASPSGAGVAWTDIRGYISFDIKDSNGTVIRTVSGTELTDKNRNGVYDLTISGLALGEVYTIEETSRLSGDGKITDKYSRTHTYTVSTDIEINDNGATKDLSQPAVTLTALSAENPDRKVTFTNTYREKTTQNDGHLTLKKEIVATDTGLWGKIADDDIEFTIKSEDGTFSKKLTKADFQLESGSTYVTKAVIDLAPGKYIIEETKQGLDGDGKIGTTYYSVATGTTSTNPYDSKYELTVYSNLIYERTFTNTYTQIDPGNIRIVKKISGTSSVKWDDVKSNIVFTITPDGSSTPVETINGTDPGWLQVGEDYYYTVSLQPGDYTVKEKSQGLDANGMILTTEYSVGTKVDGTESVTGTVTVTSGGSKDIEFDNTYKIVNSGSITINKIVEAPDGVALPSISDMGDNLAFTILRTDGDIEDENGNSINPITITGKDLASGSKKIALPYGDYTITETKNGLNGSYKIGTQEYDSTVKVSSSNDGGKNYTDNKNSQTVTIGSGSSAAKIAFKNYYLPKLEGIEISKQAVGGGPELKGANLELYIDSVAPGNLVDQWTSGTVAHKVDSTNPKFVRGHKYILVETKAPDGYLIASQIEFQVKDSGKVVAEPGSVINVNENDRVITMFDAAMSANIELVKTYSDTSISKELAQTAVFALYTDSGCTSTKEIGRANPEWSDSAQKYIVTFNGYELGLAKNTSYFLKEVSAPEGYATSTAIFECRVSNDGMSVSYSVYNNGGDAKNNKIANSKPLCNNVKYYGSVQFQGNKTVSGDTGKGNDKTYSFVVTDDDNGDKEVVRISRTGAGAITFPEIKYDSKDIGKTYHYTIREEKVTGEDYIIRDSKTYSVIVSVKEPDTSKDPDPAKLDITVSPSTTGYDFNNICIQNIVISKQMAGGGPELKGATLKLYEGSYPEGTTPDENNKIVEWTSQTTAKTISGDLLKPKTKYTLVEEAAPNGYKIASRIVFEINGNGELTSESTYASNVSGSTRVVTMFDNAISDIVISKQKAGGGAELSDAMLNLYEKQSDGTWKEVIKGGWKSGSRKTISGSLLKADTEYELRETAAPKGYKITSKITFKINEIGEIKPTGKYTTADPEFKKAGDGVGGRLIVMFDDAIRDIQISKQAITGSDELEGARLSLYEGNYPNTVPGNAVRVVKDWDSGITPTTIKGSLLKANQEYTLVEVAAPKENGFKLSTNIVFKIQEDGTITKVGDYSNGEFTNASDAKGRIVTMFDGLADIAISKKFATITGSSEVPKAKLTLYRGNSATDKLTSDDEVDSWTSDGNNHVIGGEKLKLNQEYTLREQSAPKGYQIATDITFKINAKGEVEPIGSYSYADPEFANAKGTSRLITMFDDAIDDIEIVKIFTSSDPGYIIDPTLATKTKFGLYNDEACTSSVQTANVQEDGIGTGTYKVVFTGSILTAGKTYYMKEILSPAGFTLCDDIIRCEVQKDGIVLYSRKTGGSFPAGTAEFPGCENVKNDSISRTGSITLQGKKIISGSAPSESYLFTVKEGTKVLDSASITGAGSFDFTINYTDDSSLGEHTYVISENAGSTLGMSYSAANYTVVVKVETDDNDASKYKVTILSTDDGNGDGVKATNGSEVYTFTNIYKTNPDAILISKKAASGPDDGKEIPYAELKLYEGDSTGGAVLTTLVDEWTSNGTPHTILGTKLNWDTVYTLRETAAPKGYAVTTDIIFRIDKSGKIENIKNIATGEFADASDAKGRYITMFDDAISSISISKKSATGSDELPGATLRLYEGSYSGAIPTTAVQVGAEWKSDTTAKVIPGSDLKAGQDYTLVETGAPNGYKVMTNMIFRIDNSGAVVNTENYARGVDPTGRYITMFDDAIDSISISKKTATGSDELPGAVLRLYEGSYTGAVTGVTPVDSWSSSGNAHVIDGTKLKLDTTYTLVEEGTPKGYKVATNMIFKINAAGEVENTENYPRGIDTTARYITMFDDAIDDISISKKNITGSEELSGATLSLYEGSYTGAVTGAILVESWSSSDSAHVISGTKLKLGNTYTLVEEGAPNGYKIATNMIFTIDGTGAVVNSENYPRGVDTTGRYITMFDDAISDVSISKKTITGSEELSGATLSLYEGRYTGTVTGVTPVESWNSSDSAHVISGTKLKLGATYTLVEEGSPKGYKIATNMIFKINETGEVENTENYASGIDTTGRYITMFDDAISNIFVSRQKTIDTKELPDASIKLFEGNHTGAVSGLTPIDAWTSTDTSHVINGSILKVDTEYTLVEEIAPEGSVIATNVIFKIDENGDIQPIGTYVNGEFKNATRTDRTITLLDSDDNPGAVESTSTPANPSKNTDPIIINKTFDDGKKGTRNDEPSGSKFTLYTDASCKEDSVVSGAKDVEVKWLDDNQQWKGVIQPDTVSTGKTYYLKETGTPSGYLPDTTIYEIIVNSDGTISYRILGQDALTSNMSSRATLALSMRAKAPKTDNYLNLEWHMEIILLLCAASAFCFAMKKREEKE